MSNLRFNLQRKNNVYSTPIIKIPCQNTSINCLIDTGASIPVWCSGVNELKILFPDCIKVDAVFSLSGFGTGKEITEVYMIPNFILSDGKDSIHYKNLVVAVTDRDFSFSFVFSYTMFNKMNISIDTYTNRNGSHPVSPNIKIASLKREYQVGYTILDISLYPNANEIIRRYNTKNILSNVYIFNQQ